MIIHQIKAVGKNMRQGVRFWHHRVDLRSDTVTKPSTAMLNYMREADVGDDYFHEDSTVIELENRMASICGMEAGLFVPSGTMGNFVSLGTHCKPGQEILLGDRSHIFYFEGGGASTHLGITYHTLKNQLDGTIRLMDITSAIRPKDILFAPTRLITLENTHNFMGGRVLSPDYMKRVAKIAKKNKLLFHVDGARIFNAAVAQNVTVQALLKGVDSANICISKGLGCPVGSVIVGSHDFIKRARILRKTIGGGMRQIGSLAAAGIFALDHNVTRLQDDHDNAKLLADSLAQNENIAVVTKTPDTNIVVFGFKNNRKHNAAIIAAQLKTDHNVLVNAMAGNRIRAVTHLDVNRDDIAHAAQTISNLVI